MEGKCKVVLERVAGGVWCQRENELGAWHQCAFCYRAPHAGHDDDCPVKLAEEVLDEADN